PRLRPPKRLQGVVPKRLPKRRRTSHHSWGLRGSSFGNLEKLGQGSPHFPHCSRSLGSSRVGAIRGHPRSPHRLESRLDGKSSTGGGDRHGNRSSSRLHPAEEPVGGLSGSAGQPLQT